MTASPTLFPSRRTCLLCADNAPGYMLKFDPKEPSIIALNVTIYRRARNGRQLVTTKAIHVCEPCLGIVIASRDGKFDIKASLLASALFQRVGERYSELCGVGTQ